MDSAQQLNARAEKIRAPSETPREPSDAVRVFLEKGEVETEVEDAEIFLVLVGAEQIGAEACASSNHLPELDPGVDRLKEDRVNDLRHVDSVEHVHRDRDVRGLVFLRKVVDQALRIFGVVVDQFGQSYPHTLDSAY